MTSLNVGDKVKLASGGPDMTIMLITATDLVCVWFDNDHKLVDGRFKEAMLVLIA